MITGFSEENKVAPQIKAISKHIATIEIAVQKSIEISRFINKHTEAFRSNRSNRKR